MRTESLMAEQNNRDGASLADQAEARTTVPKASNENTHAHHAGHHGLGEDHGDHDHDAEDGHDHEHPFEWQEALRIGFVAVAAALVWFRVWEPFSVVSVIGVVGLLVGGWPILKEAFENVLQRRMTMELSMTIAIVAAAAIGQL